MSLQEEYSVRKEPFSKVLEKICKKSDRLIVPMKLVMTAEGRGRRVVAFLSKTSSILEVVERWKMNSRK